MDRVLIFDTTLRDGEQALQSSLSVKEKLIIARALSKMKVDIIEAGFPVSSPGDFESVSSVAENIKGSIICGLSRAVDKDIEVCAEAIKRAERSRIHTFIATSDIHASSKLRKTNEEVLAMAVHAVKHARNLCDDVEFSCEDAGRTTPDMLCRFVEEAIKAGAKTINIPDTVGYTVGYQFGDIIKDIFARVPNVGEAVISVHCHNDLGLGTANSVMAVLNGARQVECTVNGLGERAGNASLEEIVMILKTRKDIFGIETNINTREISKTSRLVSHICGVPIQPNKAIVGSNAFSHSSGIHQDGVLKNQNTYEIMTPESVGLDKNTLNLTSRSGRAVIQHRLSNLGYEKDTYDMDKLYANFLSLADKKGSVYDDDLEALMEIGADVDNSKYTLEYLSVSSGRGIIATSTVKVSDGESVSEEAATGDGPVDATYKAISRVTGRSLTIIDYSLTGVTGGCDALGEVKLIVEYNGKRFHGYGASTDIIEASALAYINATNKVEINIKVEEVRKSKNR